MNVYGKAGVGTVAAPITARSDSGGFTAIASTGALDRDQESIAPHAFDPLPPSVPCHANHDMRVESVIGRAHPYYQGDTLMVDVTFGSSDTAQMVRQQILDGMVNTVSVAFLGATRKTIKNVMTVTAGELLAVDVVSVPSQRDARILSTRSYKPSVAAEAREVAFDAMVTLARIEIEEAERLLGKHHTQSSRAAVRKFLRSL